MYARKRRLAIDGKAMYFGGEGWVSDFRLRPSNARKISHGFHGFTRIKIFLFVVALSVRIREIRG
jgi:hypothetical protein